MNGCQKMKRGFNHSLIWPLMEFVVDSMTDMPLNFVSAVIFVEYKSIKRKSQWDKRIICLLSKCPIDLYMVIDA